VVGLCCINETIATVRLREAAKQAQHPRVKGVLREILRDEVKHSRLGWAFLASPNASIQVKRGVSQWLVRLLQANLDSLFADVKGLDDSLCSHAIPSCEQTRADVTAALWHLLLPGFESTGLDVATARDWVEAEFPSQARHSS
jgi:hypothetical protein